MSTIHYDSSLSDDARRTRLFDGEIFVLAPTPASLELVDFTREFLAGAFAPLDPETAQFDMPVDDYAALLAEAKPAYIHHPECKRLLAEFLAEVGCEPGRTYFDVPRLRTSTSDNYLTSGIAYAFHPHRDTWYSAPMCQINWWMPVYPLCSQNGMAFHPQYWDKPVENSSEIYNYQDWIKNSRFSAASHVGKDTRAQPKALRKLSLDSDTRLLPPPGSFIVFSAAHMHSSVENTSDRTRISIDFRTVNLEDLRKHSGAINVDSRCTGTTLRDYLRCTDLAHIDESLIEGYVSGPPAPDCPPVERLANE